MKLQMPFKIELDTDPEFTITAYPPDIARWENKFNKSLGGDDLRIHDMMWLAWAAAVRQGKITGQERQQFDRWIDHVLDIEPVTGEDEDQDAEADPTEQSIRAVASGS